MSTQLSEPITNYFQASNSKDPAEVKACFTADATVFDEGGTYQGQLAIASWFLETRQKYDFSVKPISMTKNAQHEVVVAEVSGNFPGSPIQLNYTFLLNDDKIQTLEIS